MIELFKVFVEENKTGDQPIRPYVLQETVYKIAKEMVGLEEAFIDLVFKKYKDEPVNDDNDLETKNNKDFFGLTPQRLKAYIKYIADRRLNLMGYKSIFNLEPFQLILFRN